MSNDLLIANLADSARKAARTLVAATYEDRQKALLNIADAIQERCLAGLRLLPQITKIWSAVNQAD